MFSVIKQMEIKKEGNLYVVILFFGKKEESYAPGQDVF